MKRPEELATAADDLAEARDLLAQNLRRRQRVIAASQCHCTGRLPGEQRA
jgi:hypothetical protein